MECISSSDLRAVSGENDPPLEGYIVGHAQLSQFGKTEGFHLQKGRCGWLILTNGKLVSALTLMTILAICASATNATDSSTINKLPVMS